MNNFNIRNIKTCGAVNFVKKKWLLPHISVMIVGESGTSLTYTVKRRY